MHAGPAMRFRDSDREQACIGEEVHLLVREKAVAISSRGAFRKFRGNLLGDRKRHLRFGRGFLRGQSLTEHTSDGAQREPDDRQRCQDFDSRRMWSDPGAADAAAFAAATPYVMISMSRDFTIAATARTSEGAQYRAELQVRLTGRTAQPYQVIAWRTPTADRDAAPTAKSARVP